MYKVPRYIEEPRSLTAHIQGGSSEKQHRVGTEKLYIEQQGRRKYSVLPRHYAAVIHSLVYEFKEGFWEEVMFTLNPEGSVELIQRSWEL